MMSDKRRQDMYRMPTVFGPATGPRRGPDGRIFDCINSPKSTQISVSFLSSADQLKALLPDRFELAGEPIVTVKATCMKEIDWLAGRGEIPTPSSAAAFARCPLSCLRDGDHRWEQGE